MGTPDADVEQAAVKYLITHMAKRLPHIHTSTFPFVKGTKTLIKKLEEIDPKKPYILLINLMEAHPSYTKLEGCVELSHLIPKIMHQVICTGQAPKWAQKIWQKAYQQYADHAAQIATDLAKRLAKDTHVIITSDHGGALGPAVFHGIPPTPEPAEVPS